MQVLLVAVGTHGDVLPFIAAGVEMRRRGHDVVLAAPVPFAGLAARAGLPFHPLGSQADYDRFVAEPELWHPRRGVLPLFDFVSPLTEPTYRWIASCWRPGEGIVGASTLSLGARVARDKLGLPLVTVHVMPLFMESAHEPPVLPGLPLPSFLPAQLRHRIGLSADRFVIGPAALPRLNAFRETLGLGPVRRLRYWWNDGPRILLMCPDWYARPQPDWPDHVTQVGFPIADRFGEADELSPELEEFLAAGEAPLAFTYGSAMRRAGAFFDTAVALCARMGRRGVLLAPQDSQVPGDLPAGVMHASYAPFSRLLPRCAALIHHGGVGTVAQALAAGAPQLVVPVAFDHFDEAARLIRLGVGASLSRRRFTPARAARVLGDLLASPEVAGACARIKERMAGEDGVTEACDALERVSRANPFHGR